MDGQGREETATERHCLTPVRGLGEMVIGRGGQVPQMPACPALLSILGGQLENLGREVSVTYGWAA